MRKIENLYAEIDGKKIFKRLHFTVNAGGMHAILRPTGAGCGQFLIGRRV